MRRLEPEEREIVLGALRRAERTEAQLRYLADHDSLTGLLDRRRFRSELDQYASFAKRYGGQGAVMIFDIDGLKAVNDKLGTSRRRQRDSPDRRRDAGAGAGDGHDRPPLGRRVRGADAADRRRGRGPARRGPPRSGRRVGAPFARVRAGHDQRRGRDLRRLPVLLLRCGPDRRRRGDVQRQGGWPQPGRSCTARPMACEARGSSRPRRPGSATPSPTTASASSASRSTASRPAESSATSCSCE